MAQSSFQTIKDHWDEILSFLRENYNIIEVTYNLWLAPLVPHHISGSPEKGLTLHILIPEISSNSKEKLPLHLDVYKRQSISSIPSPAIPSIRSQFCICLPPNINDECSSADP